MNRIKRSPSLERGAPNVAFQRENAATKTEPAAEFELGAAASTPAAVELTHRARDLRSPPAWLIGPVFLAATATGIVFVIRGPDRFFGMALGALFGLSLVWILISALLPAKADRTCPSCGRERLRRIDQRTTRGVVCSACGHADPEQSSFLMAEEEGTLETIVLAERASSRERADRR